MLLAGCSAKSRRRPRVSTADDTQHYATSTAVSVASDGQPSAGAHYLADVLRSTAEGRRSLSLSLSLTEM